MALIKYNKNRFPSILDEFFNDDWFNFLPEKDFKTFTPLGDVIEKDDAFNVELMLPGFDKKDIKMKVDGDSLLIEAERVKNEKDKYNRVESYFGKYTRSFTLPNYVNKNKIDAAYENGVLKVTIPKTAETVQTKLIEIK